jgi:ricin-type beta-trefoil lectin protein
MSNRGRLAGWVAGKVPAALRGRRAVSLLFVAALAVVASAGVGAAAQATTASAVTSNTVTPAPATFYEITPPFISPTSPKCVDVPSASTSIGTALQLFHCKSSSNQLFQFVSLGNDLYLIQNRNSALCLRVSSSADGTAVRQDTCSSGVNNDIWHITSPIDPTHFNLANQAFPSECMAAANNSGADHTALVIMTCNPGNSIVGENQLQTWQLA